MPGRVGFLIDRWEPRRGGAESALDALARRLEERGHEVVVFAERCDDPRRQHVRVKARGLLRTTRERRLAQALVAAADDASCDVTIGIRHLPRVDLFWPHGGVHRVSVEARLESRGRRAGPLRGRHRPFAELERQLLEGGGARRVACVSELVRDEFAREYPGCDDRLVVVENGVDLSRFDPARRVVDGERVRAELGVDAGVPLVALVAREPRLKGLPSALEAFARSRHEDAVLVVRGLRRPAPFDAAARALGLEQRVRFEAPGDTAELLAAVDLGLAPTFRDTSSLFVLECLAAGVPVVTTERAGAAPRVARGGPDAGVVLAAPGDPATLATAIDTALERVRAGVPTGVPAGVLRERIRACVADLDAGDWLDRLANEVAALARGRSLTQ